MKKYIFPKSYKWKLVNKTGKAISHHKTKGQAERAQARSNRADRYVRKR